MSDWTRVAKLEDVPEDSGMEAIARGRVVALFRVGGEMFAMDGVCPHAGGPIAEGSLDGCIVTCPWHGWQFDVTSGQHTLSPTLHHTTYATRVEDGWVEVRLDEIASDDGADADRG